MTFLKCALALSAASFSLFKQENNKNHFLLLFYVSSPHGDVIALGHKNDSFHLRTAHRTTPDECASVGAHYVSCSRDYVMFQCLALEVQLHPKWGGREKNLATLQKGKKAAPVVHSNVASFSFLSFHCRSLGVLRVTRNLNDIFLEVMFSIAKQK